MWRECVSFGTLLRRVVFPRHACCTLVTVQPQGIVMETTAESSRNPLHLAVGALVFLVFLALVALAVREWLVLDAEFRIGHSTLDAVSLAQEISEEGRSVSPETLVSLAEQLVALGPDHDDEARELLLRALERDEGRPYAWTLLAFVETRRTGTFSADARDALARSLEVCPLCEKELLRWRLEFVITHWDEVPASIRAEVFRGADFLRWWHLDAEFLQIQKERAAARGIPFADYQRAVNSPVRPHEITD